MRVAMKNFPYIRQRGFTLVELMIALLIGLIVVGAAGSMFLANNRVYGATESVGRIQENARTAFELMARDIREAGSTPCGQSRHISSVLPAVSKIRLGIEQVGAVTAPALDIYHANDSTVEVVQHIQPNGNLGVASTAGISAGSALVACNADGGILFGVDSVGAGEITPAAALGNARGAGVCLFKPDSANWGSECAIKGNSNSYVAKPVVHRWQVRQNGRGSRSLYMDRRYLSATGNWSVDQQSIEVAEGIEDMQLKFRRKNDTAFQNNVAGWTEADWQDVVAVEVALQIRVTEGAQTGESIRGTDGQILTRSLLTTTTLRNREGVL
ncbi:hypothetical protein CO611_03790 [Lysobacteraceae bacterium NML03-0222]|nr:hypothetical protein CO611_03790 [Xanthomonadaceae bacterium NML03-0222]